MLIIMAVGCYVMNKKGTIYKREDSEKVGNEKGLSPVKLQDSHFHC